MARPIDADALTRRIYGEERPELYDGAQEVEWIEKCIETAPTLSLDEVRGVGTWLSDEEDTALGMEGHCSKCCCCTPNIRFKYCPNCGAKMGVE